MYYAVAEGRRTGIFSTWEECKQQVLGFSGARFKKFDLKKEAENFVYNGTKSSESELSTIVNTNLPYAFVDGSYNQDTETYGYGCVLVYGDNCVVLNGHGDKKDFISSRNVSGEIHGAMAAVNKAEEIGLSNLTIIFDYRGIKDWAIGEWLARSPVAIHYADFMKDGRRRVKLDFEHVKGHSGIVGNEIADAVAKNSVGLTPTRIQMGLINRVYECDKAEDIKDLLFDTFNR